MEKSLNSCASDTKKDITIIHIITGLGTGGAESMLYRLLEHQASKYNHVVISLTDGGKHKHLIENLGIQVEVLRPKVSLSFIITSLKMIRRLCTTKKTIIHAWMYHSFFIGLWFKLLSSRKLKIGFIFNVRHSLSNIEYETRKLQFIIRLIRFGISFCDAVVFNSRKSLEHHLRYWNCSDTAVFIPNGFDVKYWSKTNTVLTTQDLLGPNKNLDSDVQILLSVGRAHPMKNQIGLLEAFQAIAPQCPNLHLVLVGKGTESFDEKISSYRNRIHLLGERVDIKDIMNASDFFVLSSSWGEGFPNVLAEAILMNLSCISTDVGDAFSLIQNDDYLIQPGNHKQLGDAITRLYKEPQKARKLSSLQSRKNIASNFSINKICSYYDNVYEAVVS